ncbi:MAG: hypothetical protein K0R26_2861 [Bacteroidota bacterium]|nr:hypothetical protein [Bacteroidota bacterium]
MVINRFEFLFFKNKFNPLHLFLSSNIIKKAARFYRQLSLRWLESAFHGIKYLNFISFSKLDCKYNGFLYSDKFFVEIIP